MRLGKEGAVEESNTDEGWVDSAGNVWTEEQVERKFDGLTKISLKHRAKDAIEKYMLQTQKFPVMPDEYLEHHLSSEFDINSDKVEVKLKNASMYFENDLVANAVSRLSDADKEILEWLYICDYTEKTIAEWLQIKEESVTKRKYRAIRRLRQSLGVIDDGAE